MGALDDLKASAQAEVESLRDRLIGISHEIHSHPELAMQEHMAAETLAAMLEQAGFNVTRGVAGLPTAFLAELGHGEGRTVGILAEYDALPSLGHACGHNTSAASTIGAGLAVSKLLQDGRLPGRIKVFGTPAEEGGGGKVFMANAGLFDGLTAALAMHASQQNAVGGSCLAVRSFILRFHGKPAHSAASPHDGINALDGVIQTFNGINALRQHVKPDVRIHGIITNGGQATNIVPELAEARITVRSASKDYLSIVAEKVLNCARGAVIQTGATLEIENGLQYDDIMQCAPLSHLMKANMERLGLKVTDLTGFVTPASSDLGNVSHVVPTEEGNFAIVSPDVAYHTEGFRLAAGGEAGDRAVIYAAKTLAMTAIDLLQSETAAAAVHQGFELARGESQD